MEGYTSEYNIRSFPKLRHASSCTLSKYQNSQWTTCLESKKTESCLPYEGGSVNYWLL